MFVVVCLAVIGVQAAAAATLVVDDDGVQCPAPDFNTINAAIAVAAPGDTIQVCAGLYMEMVNVNVNNLTLLGAKAFMDARTRTFVPADESIIDHPCGPVQITADNVVLDGFTVQGSTLDPMVFFACFGSGIWTNPGFSSTQGGHKIRNNIVQNNISGIFLNSTCAIPTSVQFNLIRNNSNPGAGQGNGIDSELGLCNAAIDNNSFSGHTNTSMFLVGGQTNIVISNNELVGGTPERIFLANTTASSVTANVSVGSTSSGTIRLFSGNSNVTINGNTLFNGMRGIRVDDLDPFNPAANSAIAAHFNCIQGNSIAGLEVAAGDHTGTLNAENNWWGHQTGPNEIPRNPTGMGDRIIDPAQVVDFDPWLRSCPSGAAAPRQATGGGQIDVAGGRGSFGFVAKQDTQDGHLNYTNHVTGAHLNCTVTAVTFTTTTSADFSGPCSSNSSAAMFTAHVEDHGKNNDVFRITYNLTTEGGPIARGQVNIK